MANRAGQATFVLNLNDKLSSRLKQVGAGVVNATKKIAQAATAVGAASLAIGVAASKAFANYGDMIDKMSVRTRIGREALQELSFAAQLTGTNIDSLSQAMFRASRRIGNASMGTGPAVRALNELNLSAAELSRMKPEDQFEKLVEALGGVADENMRNQLAFEIFGDNFRQIQPLIAAGADGIREMREEAAELGLVLSADDISKAAAMTDKWTTVTEQLRFAFMRLGASLSDVVIPFLVGVSELLKRATTAALVLSMSVKGLMASAGLPIVTFGQNALGGGFDDELVGGGLGGIVDKFEDVQGFSSGLAASFGSSLFSRIADPKTEEKQMVEILGQIRDRGPLLMEQ